LLLLNDQITILMKNKVLFAVFWICAGLVSAQTSQAINADCLPPAKITITKFTSGKDFKVVIGNKINYKSKGDKTPPMLWKMGKFKNGIYSDTFAFSTDTASIIPPLWKDKGDVYIPKSQLPISNNDFGLSRGSLLVSTASSPSLTDDEQVKVFFNKNDRNVHDSVPNWFYYWKQTPIIQDLLTIPGFTLFDSVTCTYKASPTPVTLSLKYINNSTYSSTGSNEYGYCKFNASNMEKFDPYPKCDKITDPSRTVLAKYTNTSNTSTTIFIGKVCGFDKTMRDGTLLKGIHVLYSTIIHEREHAIIECENWDKDSLAIGVGKGYSSLWDQDNDGYKDVWEVSHTGFKVELTPFNGQKDAYGLDITGNPVTYDSSRLGMGLYSAGTEYEEARCRQTELNSRGLFNNINQYDWSFDKSKIIQGKQW
jgi:hypothetical protein